LTEDENGSVDFVGNRTECALLMMLHSWGDNYREIRDIHHANVQEVYGFTSERKMASVLLRTSAGGHRLYNKGAADWVIQRCVASVDSQGRRIPMNDAQRQAMIDIVNEMASRGLRTLCLSYRDFPPEHSRPADFFKTPHEEDLTALCIVGIKDPVRKEVADAVATCQRAGIRVRMVTGDNIYTARHIAAECGILTKDGVAMEGPEFRAKTEDELIELLPSLQVLARSSPQDKFILVQTLKKMGDVVAVTGDGTNDAPALKESDVGLAMGIAGTEVAKEAADIVILDDNFSSIVKSVLWGRCVFTNIRKFLQFQLTINLVALIVAFVAAVTSGETPLNVLQLLWVNLIMDSFAALALATEAPTPDLLNRRPHGRNEPLINGTMGKHILVQGAYQCMFLFLIFYYLTDGCRRTVALIFPVMDRKHNSIKELDGRAISDNCQRAAVKAIATFTGLGLRLYAGEDIPKEDEKGSPKLPLQQEAPKQAARTSKAPTGAKAPAEASGAAPTPAADDTSAFDAKASLTTICKANPFGYADEKASMALGKAALETIGLSRATEIKTWQQFGNVAAAMMTLWAKEEQMVITKAEMTKEIDIVRACDNADAMVEAMKAFITKKQ